MQRYKVIIKDVTIMKPEAIRDWVEETLNKFKEDKLVSYTETPHKATIILENPDYTLGYIADCDRTECS